MICEFEFPSRYSKYAVDISALTQGPLQSDRVFPMNAEERMSLLDAITHCFGGKKPQVLCTQRGLLDLVSEEVMNFLSELKYFTCQLYESLREIASLEMILKGAVDLEVYYILKTIVTGLLGRLFR